MKILLVLSLCVYTAYAELTDAELASFYNEGSEHCGGSVSITDDGDTYTVTSNGLPDHYWACTNPNVPAESTMTFTVSKNPVALDTPKCLSSGPIAVAVNGVRMYGPLTSAEVNAVEGEDAEAFDLCGGHPTAAGEYHYHHLPVSTDECDNPVYDVCEEEAQFLGISLDGYPIYSQGTYDGVSLEDEELDQCHGVTLPDGRYAYVAIRSDFPYLLGCFSAEPAGSDDVEDCPDGGDSGYLCHCSDDGDVAWYEYDDVTTESSSRKEKDTEKFLSLLRAIFKTRTRRSPRFDVMRHLRDDEGSVDACHYDGDEYYSDDGECAGDGDYEVNNEDQDCD